MTLLLFSLNPANAVQQIIGTVDQTQIPINGSLTFSVSLIGINNDNINFQQDTPDYRVVATSTSSSFRFVNGQSSKSKTYKFVIKPKHPGRFTIPTATVNSEGNTYSTNPIEITVSAQASQPAPPPRRTAPRNSVGRRRSTARKSYKKPFAKLIASKSNPYVNEQIHLSLKVYHKGNLRNLNIEDFNLDEFISEKDDKAKEYQETIGMEEYLVYELNIVLFPIKSGTITIPPTELIGVIFEDRGGANISSFDPFRLMNPFLVQKKHIFSTNSITLNVRPLPAGAPKGFTGYVGDLAVNHSINQDSIKSGNAVTLQSKIYGNGHFKNLKLDLVKDSKQYGVFKDKENVKEEINNSIKYFESISKTAIIPNKDSGKASINTVPLISFNPKTNQYESHGSNHFEINVLFNPDKEKTKSQILSGNGKTIRDNEEPKIKEILTISNGQIVNHKTLPIKVNTLLIVIIAINLLAFIEKLYRLALNRPSKDTENKFKLNQALDSLRKADGVAEVSKVLKEAVNKVNLNGGSEAAELKEKLDSFFEESDRANYSKGSAISKQELEYFRLNAISLMKELSNA